MARTFFEELIANRPLMAAMTAWLLAQLLKVPFHYLFTKQWSIWRIFGSGGMPSSHSAATLTLAVSIGFERGFDSPLFAATIVLAGIVMYDAAGVRRAAGKQAGVINDIIEMLNEHQEITDEKLKELIGHTPIEVIGGAILGIIISLLFGYR